MSKQEDTPTDSLDPVVLAAMIEDPDEDEEDKKLREDLLQTSDTVTTDDEDEDDEDEDEEDKGKKDDEDDDDEEKDNKEKVDPKRPPEAKDDTDDDIEEDDDKKKTRKEKRQARSDTFFESILKDDAKSGKKNPKIPAYKPIDYGKPKYDEQGNVIEFKPDELDQDREMVGAVKFAEGVNEAKYWGEQESFWKELGNEGKILAYDPALSFLSETTPDGKENPNFDPDKTHEINAIYLQMCGFEQFQKTNDKGQPLVDAQSGKPIMVYTVDRTDISYEKFARQYVERMNTWADEKADDRVEETRKNITKQRKTQGIRPGGGSRKSIGSLNHGDISKMSDEDFEKNEAEIDRQILNML